MTQPTGPGQRLPDGPAGAEFGLEPINPELYEQIFVPPNSKSIVSTEDYRTGSELGGVSGLIQPTPHVPTARERVSMIYAIDPADPGDRVGSVVAPDLEGDFSNY